MSYLSDRRAALAAALVGTPPDLTTGPNLEALRDLPAVIIEPDPAEWLEGAPDGGPGRVVRLSLVVSVVVSAQEPSGALEALEAALERVLGRIPREWRIDRAEGPQRVANQGGEITALRASFSVSTRYSIT